MNTQENIATEAKLTVHRKHRLSRMAVGAPLFLVILSFGLMAIGNWFSPGFASANNVLQLLKLSSFLGLLSVGQTMVMLTGGIDLSLAWVLTGSAVVYTGLCDGQDGNLAPAVAAAISVGLCTGLINGLGIVLMRISPIIMTLAMNNIMLGATLIYTGGTPGGSNSPMLRELVVSSIFGMPSMVILWVIISAVAIIAIKFTRGGRMLLAVGESQRVSYLTGIANDHVIVSAYVVAGVMASLAGIFFAAFSGASFLGMGDQFILPSIVAVVLGGTSVFGGRGGYGGTMVAVIFTTILSTVLVIENISTGIRSIAFGLVVLAAIILQTALSRSGEIRQ
jgi:ribose transport system permease protein